MKTLWNIPSRVVARTVGNCKRHYKIYNLFVMAYGGNRFTLYSTGASVCPCRTDVCYSNKKFVLEICQSTILGSLR